MPRRNQPIPHAVPVVISKRDLLDALSMIDADPASRARVLRLESGFRTRISAHIATLPTAAATFATFNTNPFVLMIHCLNRHYSRISQIEKDIPLAKEFMSMETSAGRMVEDVALPVYGWQVVPSAMHTAYSALDGKQLRDDTLYLATLKSGPRCLNDEMSENFADSILNHSATWASDHNIHKIDFTYGVLYGTQSISNKKDWHIIRNVIEKLEGGTVLRSHANSWWCEFTKDGLKVKVTVRIGRDWWSHLGGSRCFVEICTSLIRACVRPDEPDAEGTRYSINDLAAIVSTDRVPTEYNVALLQNGQIPWLFFLARHFCDSLTEGY